MLIHIGHVRNNPEYLQEIIAKTNAQQPDVIVLTGDDIMQNLHWMKNILNP